MKWLKSIFRRERTNNYHVNYEKSDAIRVFEDLEETHIKKKRLVHYHDRLNFKQQELASYEMLTEEDLAQLTLLVGQHRGVQDKKQNLKGRLIKTNKSLQRLEAYEEELPDIMQEVAMTERKVKEYERDIFYLEEEKEELEEERDVLLKGYQFLKVFGIVLLGVVTILIFLGLGLLQVLRETVWVYMSVISIALIFFLGGIFYAKDRLEKGLRDNETLQKKAVMYINKSKIRYFHGRRYLDFYFDKLGVDSSAKLEMYYNRYVKNKNNQIEYNKLNRAVMNLEVSIQELFEKRSIVFEDLDNLQEWVLAPQKATALKNLLEEKEKVMQQIKGLEAFEEALWKEVFVLKENPTYTGVIEDKIQEYMILTKQHLDKAAVNA